MHRQQTFGGIDRLAADGAKRPEGDGADAGGGRSCPIGVRDPDPGAAGVFGVVEPVSADLISGEDVAGEGRAADARDAGGKRFCWISAAGLVFRVRRTVSM